MNMQLQLLYSTTVKSKDTKIRSKHRDHNQSQSVIGAQTHANDWKLTDQERQLGLASVRAIRTILQNTTHNKQEGFQKAS